MEFNTNFYYIEGGKYALGVRAKVILNERKLLEKREYFFILGADNRPMSAVENDFRLAVELARKNGVSGSFDLMLSVRELTGWKLQFHL